MARQARTPSCSGVSKPKETPAEAALPDFIAAGCNVVGLKARGNVMAIYGYDHKRQLVARGYLALDDAEALALEILNLNRRVRQRDRVAPGG
jgi:hypothetical protein